MEILRSVIKRDGNDDSKNHLSIQMNLCNLPC